MPRVNGNSPGVSRAPSAGTSAGPYTRLTGSPQDVSGSRSLPLIGDSSQRDVAVLPRRVGVALGSENGQRGAQPRARVARLDDLVHVAALGGHVRVRELRAVFADARLPEGRGIVRRLELAPVQDVDGALGSHHRDLGRREREVGVAAMSRQPARCAGWLATMPTGRPPSRPKPTTMFGA